MLETLVKELLGMRKEEEMARESSARGYDTQGCWHDGGVRGGWSIVLTTPIPITGVTVSAFGSPIAGPGKFRVNLNTDGITESAVIAENLGEYRGKNGIEGNRGK